MSVITLVSAPYVPGHLFHYRMEDLYFLAHTPLSSLLLQLPLLHHLHQCFQKVDRLDNGLNAFKYFSALS